MGQPSPYKEGIWDDIESDFEEESDDDLIVETMSDEKLKSLVVDIVKQIFETSYTVDVALINLRQVKHMYSKDNLQCANAIYQAILNYVS